jgi:hypothetical protein
MDSRLIYSASEKVKHLLSWPKSTDSEWVYFGAGHEVNVNTAMDMINEWFADTKLYIAIDRKHSLTFDKSEFLSVTSEILGYKDFLVWNIKFDKSIEFNHIGVLRRGMVVCS